MRIESLAARWRTVAILPVRYCAALMVSALFVVATPATAAIKIATFTGGGFGGDSNKIFYDVTDPNAIDWVATVTYDTAGSTRETFPGTNDVLVSNPTLLASTFTANGVTLPVDVTGGTFRIFYGEFVGIGGATVGEFSVNLRVTGPNRYIFNLMGSSVEIPLPLSFENNFSPVALEGNQDATFEFDNFNGSFLLSSRTISVADAPVVVVPGPVPEPATWAMMIIGFGAAGSMIRRRKAVVD